MLPILFVPRASPSASASPRLRPEPATLYKYLRGRASRRPARRSGGSVIVIVALALITLLGFSALATDYGLLVSDANRLQRACDAAALAGATQLKKTGNDQVDVANARQAAIDMMAQYKVAGFDGNTITFNATWDHITVPASATRKFFFAGVFKLINPNSPSTGQVARQAVAGRTALKGVPGVSPLAITTADYLAYKSGILFEPILINNNQSDFTLGTMSAIDLRLNNSGKSGTVFQNDVDYGTPGTTVIGQAVQSAINADLNSQGNKLQIAITDRITRAASAPWNDNGNTYAFPNYPNSDPRVMTIMVADPSPANNSNPMLTARFFVSVYIDRIRSLGNGATYLRMRILPSNTFSSDRTDIIVGDASTPFTGPSVVGLTS